jgi:dihydrofolate synthase/folylpolyglutamate synthase
MLQRNPDDMTLGIEEGLDRCARFGVKPGLGAIAEVCRMHGDPQNAMRVVHVAGTNGKGATCALIESSLRAAGDS